MNEWCLQWWLTSFDDSVDVWLHGSVRLICRPGWSGKMCIRCIKGWIFAGMFFCHMDFIWISHDFHSCCVVFSSFFKNAWQFEMWGPLRHFEICSIFCFVRWSEVFLPFQRVGKSISMLTGRLTFLRSMHRRIRISRSVKGGINLTPKLKASDFCNFSFGRLDFCPISLIKFSSHSPLHCFWNFDGGMGWRGTISFGLSGRNNKITSWQRRFWMWNLNVDLCISRSSFHNVTAESKTSMDFTWCFRSFGEARFFGTVTHVIPDAKKHASHLELFRVYFDVGPSNPKANKIFRRQGAWPWGQLV